MKKTLIMLLAAALAVSSLSFSADTVRADEADTVVTILGTNSTETYDPLVYGTMDAAVRTSLYDSLLRFDENANVQPMLAESWEDSGTEVIFHLRQGVKGHDGTEFDADDVIFSLDTKMQEPTNYYILNYLSSWEKVDQYTVKITKTYPFVNFYEVIASNYGVGLIVSKEAYEEKGPEKFAQEPVGFGPYTVESKGVDGSITLKAFEDYWGGKPAFNTLVVKAPIDMNTAIISLENNELDLIQGVPASQYNTIRNNNALVLDECSSLATYQIQLMNTLSSDVNLRKAIAYGVNRDSLIILATEGTGQKITDMYSPFTMRDLAGTFEDVPYYDPEKAAEYLAQSDYVPGTPIRVTVYDPQGVAVAQSIQNDLGKLGITIQVEQVDVNAYGSMLINGEMEIMTGGMGGAPVALEDMLMYWETDNPIWGPQFAHTEEYDQIIAQLRTETDLEKIRELTRRAMEIQYELCNFVGLWEDTQAIAYNSRIEGAYSGTMGTYGFYPQDLKPAGQE